MTLDEEEMFKLALLFKLPWMNIVEFSPNTSSPLFVIVPPVFEQQTFKSFPNYNGSSCDTIHSQAINQPGTLGVSLTSTLGNKCNGGNNLGLIVGLSVGIPVFVILLLGIITFVSRKKKKNRLKNFAEQEKPSPEFNQNNAFGGGTKWTENNATTEMEGI